MYYRLNKYNTVTPVAQMSIICLHTYLKMLTLLVSYTVSDVFPAMRNVPEVLLHVVSVMHLAYNSTDDFAAG